MTGQTSLDSLPIEIESALAAGHQARTELAGYSPARRRELLDACAEALRGAADELVVLAGKETNLPEARLRGELARTIYQFEAYGAAIETLTPAEIDLANADAVVPQPDLRRTARPLGLTLVFAASNFPFAFSVAGTDTASALAAGCPVIVKAHPGHPELSVRTAELVQAALASVGAPAGTFGLIGGVEAGVSALQDPRVAASAFTGSLAGGQFLARIAANREQPIPFYGELGSLNPVVVAPHAATHRTDEILDGYLASFTLGAGQFCTKPGLLFWPADVALPTDLAAKVTSLPVHEMLNAHLASAFRSTLDTVISSPAVKVLAASQATMVTATAADVLAHPEVLVECFGPATTLITYAEQAELTAVLGLVHGTLTASIHADSEDIDWLAATLPTLEEKAGRMIWNQWPTGVAVCASQHHGGPFPATTSPLHTSVGTHAIDRFLRPIAYQNFPTELLPEQLRR